MEAILMTVEMGDNVIQLSDSGIVDDLPRYTVHSIIKRKVRIELFETLADAEVYVERLKKGIENECLATPRRSSFRSFSADFNPATLDN